MKTMVTNETISSGEIQENTGGDFQLTDLDKTNYVINKQRNGGYRV